MPEMKPNVNTIIGGVIVIGITSLIGLCFTMNSKLTQLTTEQGADKRDIAAIMVQVEGIKQRQLAVELEIARIKALGGIRPLQ